MTAKRPTPLDTATSTRLQRQARRDTRPELEIRSLLHRRGLRFRVDRKPLADQRFRADIVFGPAKVAVFIDGCFWHGCPIHGTMPKNNREWWRAKLLANEERDQRTNRALIARGWLPLRFWEHEDALEAASAIATAVAARSPAKQWT